MANVSATSGSTGNMKQDIDSARDYRELRQDSSKILNLNASTLDVLKYIQDRSEDPDMTETELKNMQFLLQKRSQTSSMLTNMLRVLGDAAQRVIGNIR